MEITIKCEELVLLANALNSLATAISKEQAPRTIQTQQSPAEPQAAAVQFPSSVPAQAIPTAQPQQAYQQQPQQIYSAPATAPPPAAAVPVATQANYTLDQLAVAATPLMDAGRQAELVNLLASYGVQALTMLPKEQYGAFATALRGLGAKI